VEREVKVVVRGVTPARILVVPVALRDHYRLLAVAHMADVVDDEVRALGVARRRRRRRPQESTVRIVRVDPEEELVRYAGLVVLATARLLFHLHRHVLHQELWVNGIAQVEESERRRDRVAAARVDDRATAEVENDEQVLLRPDTELARRL
jgi:hypothetical protein